MARHKKSYHRKSSGGFLGGGMLKKLVFGAAVGMATPYVMSMVNINLPVDSKIVGAGAGFAVGGVPGAIGAFVAPMLLGGQPSTGGAVYQ